MGYGDAAGYGGPSIQHLWREYNNCILGKLGMERNQELMRIRGAVADFIKRSKTDYNINAEQVETAQALMAEIQQKASYVQPAGEFPEEDQNRQ